MTSNEIGDSTCLKVLTGKCEKYRTINVVDRVRFVGKEKLRGLIGLHNFSGADWGAKYLDEILSRSARGRYNN